MRGARILDLGLQVAKWNRFMMAPRSPQFVQEEDELPLKVPGSHVEQLTASPSEYVPPLHDAQLVAPTRGYTV